MTTYLLDFTQTPLKPAAGGQLHLVGVGDDPDCEHDGIEAAITHLVKSFGLVGETDRFVPKARVWHSVVPRYLASVTEVQVEPASLARPKLPTREEVLSVFPTATELTAAEDNDDMCSFMLGDFDVDMSLRDDLDEPFCVNVYIGTENAVSKRGKDWAALVRSAGKEWATNETREGNRLLERAAALAAALGDTP